MELLCKSLPIVELRARLPLYLSDWRDAWHRKVISAALLMFFTSIGPALTFGEYLTSRVGNNYGTVEVGCLRLPVVRASWRVPSASLRPELPVHGACLVGRVSGCHDAVFAVRAGRTKQAANCQSLLSAC
jgi:hypothetical protein